jgi:hypothetical protein
MGWLDLLSGSVVDSRMHFGAALALAGDGDVLSVADQMQGFASADAGSDPMKAMTLFGAAQRIRDDLETPLGPPWVRWVEPAIEQARTALPAQIAEAAWRTGQEMSTAEAVAMVRTDARDSAITAPATTVKPSPSSRQSATFRREGEYWTVGFDGREIRLRDSKGLRVLAFLLDHPTRPFAALDLERLGLPGDKMIVRAAATGDAGELIDDSARVAYRARVTELRELIAEAEDWDRADVAGALREEMDFINRELSRALGINGRSRRAGSVAERARLNVTRAVKSAIQRVAGADAALGAHLNATVHTGMVCTYTPDPRVPITWHVSEGVVQHV